MSKDTETPCVKKCYEVRSCPASAYLECPAYAQGKNCWETSEKICCRRHDPERCKTCEVYLAARGLSKEEIDKILLEKRKHPEYNTAGPKEGQKAPSAPRKE